MSFENEQHVVSPLVAPLLVIRKIPVSRSHRVQKTLLVNKGEKRDTLPSHPLPVHIDLEGRGIEVDNRRSVLCHQVVERLRDVSSTSERTPGEKRSGTDAEAGGPTLQRGIHPSTVRMAGKAGQY